MRFFNFLDGWWLELQSPWWVLLLAPLCIGIWLRYRRSYIGKVYHHLQLKFSWGRLWSRIPFALVYLLTFLMMLSIVAALVDVTQGYVVVQEKRGRHRIFVWVDSSSSMFGFSTPLSSITCQKNAEYFIRIKGACRALYRLLGDIEKINEKKDFSGQDLIGIGQFAQYSYVVSYPSNDYARLREKVDRMEFMSPALGIFTNIHLAMWDMYLMALERNGKVGSGLTHLSGKELRLLARSVEPGSKLKEYVPPRELRDKLFLIREELKDTTFLFITDALYGQMENVLEQFPYSLKRQLLLASYLEMPVYFLSTDDFHPELKRLARLTGFGPPDGKYRGDFLMVQKEGDLAYIEELVTHIIQARFSLTISSPVERRESYAWWGVLAALTFGAGALFWWKTSARSLTDI